MKKRVDLVFRTVGERTSELALELAQRHIQPDRTFVVDHVMPFSAAVDHQLRLTHDCDSVVYVDADCLILEDMRPFLDWNERPYVDSYVLDRFRGRIHCGVHITRIDLVRAMQQVAPPKGELAYALRPESAIRNVALRKLGVNKGFKGFRILHDHFQSYTSIFEKYALRELRSRTAIQRPRLASAMERWGEELDFVVARRAIAHARANVPESASPAAVTDYIEALPAIAESQVGRMDLPSQAPLRIEDIGEIGPGPAKPRVFGLGLSRTGTRSLTTALHAVGWDTIHYPTDAGTLADLARGDGRFHLLQHYDGLTDITVSPYYAQLDALHPDAKFVLTVRDEESWLRSAANHWHDRPAFDDPRKDETHMRIRRLLRAAVYGCYGFDRERFAYVHRRHVEAVKRHFAGRPDKLLVYPLTAGAGWEPLCEFLGVPVPSEPFPHRGRKLSQRMAGAA
ncbi:MAG: sulfotransferase family protein [Myxococcota bacterium]